MCLESNIKIVFHVNIRATLKDMCPPGTNCDYGEVTMLPGSVWIAAAGAALVTSRDHVLLED